jgi:hypothetical protein
MIAEDILMEARRKITFEPISDAEASRQTVIDRMTDFCALECAESDV